jgi:hypothetical protein
MNLNSLKALVVNLFKSLGSIFASPVTGYVIVAIFVAGMLYLAMHQVKTSLIP